MRYGWLLACSLFLGACGSGAPPDLGIETFSGTTLADKPDLHRGLEPPPRHLRTQFLPALARAPRPEVAAVLGDASPQQLRASVDALLGFEERSIAGLDQKPEAGNAGAARWIADRFTQLGYDVTLHGYRKRAYGMESNVIAEKRGSGLPGEVFMVVAHFDDVGKSHAGADDNASGIAVALEMARLIAGVELRRTVRFVAANGEEAGIVGSAAYVKRLTDEGTVGQVKLAIDLDMVAYNSDGIVDLETNTPYVEQAEIMAQRALAYTTLTARITTPAWGSDHVPFLRAGIPAVLTIEHWETHTPHYHRASDLADTLNYDYATEVARFNVASLLEGAELAVGVGESGAD